MAVDGRAIPAATTSTGTCFLCSLEGQVCDIGGIEGTLVSVDRDASNRLTQITLSQPDAGPVHFILPPAFRETLRHLDALPLQTLTTLRARALHVRRSPGDDAGWAAALVLEPDTLFNITDINTADYCPRHFPLRRLVPSAPNVATLRGTIVHSAFKEMLKDTARTRDDSLGPALRAHATDLALRRIALDEMTAEVEPHLCALERWIERDSGLKRGDRTHARAETFLLAPEVGLRGRLDFLLTGSATHGLLELKTGRASGNLPKRDHRWQVHGYQALLSVRHPDPRAMPSATLLYSATPHAAEGYGVPFVPRDLWRVLDLRNQLAIIHKTGHVPDPPGATRCERCSLLSACGRASRLLGWNPPGDDDAPDESDRAGDEAAAWFRDSYEQLRLEGLAAEHSSATLWRDSAAERQAAGSAIGNLRLAGEPVQTASGEWRYRFRCENVSELREGDMVLLSDGDPIRGQVVTGTILAVEEGAVTVWTPETIENPRQLDRYENDIVHARTVRNLWRWLDAEPRLRALVAGQLAPAFDPHSAPRVPGDLNPDQADAVRRALSARDFFLVQGPPGTGKTRVVAEIIMAAVARGERVLLSAFTNQAVDTVLRRLRAGGFERSVRLGQSLSVSPDLHAHLLVPRGPESDDTSHHTTALNPRAVYDRLTQSPVVAATTATWAAERYDNAGPAMRFDLAVIDEASQLTIPTILGALRLAPKFVLVGDERQLPPLVMSEDAARMGLRESLFARLRERWGESASTSLRVQYRMHPVICRFPSDEFYDGRLAAAAGLERDVLACDLAAASPLKPILMPERPAVFIDVPEPAPLSRISMLQARVAARTTRALLEAGVPGDQIGIITPYRAQVAAIRQRLDMRGVDGVSVDTVDRFQGAERDVILLVLGGSQEPRASQRESFVADPHRLNVALTRARKKLVIIGEQRALRQHQRFARLLSYQEALYGGRGGVVTARIVDESAE